MRLAVQGVDGPLPEQGVDHRRRQCASTLEPRLVVEESRGVRAADADGAPAHETGHERVPGTAATSERERIPLCEHVGRAVEEWSLIRSHPSRYPRPWALTR